MRAPKVLVMVHAVGSSQAASGPPRKDLPQRIHPHCTHSPEVRCRPARQRWLLGGQPHRWESHVGFLPFSTLSYYAFLIFPLHTQFYPMSSLKLVILLNKLMGR